MIDTTSFAKLVPGFVFLQKLLQGAGQAVPPMGQWIAPTLDPAELEKRIGELKTVQFWLEQNARLLGATIQAMEVQRMTLSTLQTMNLPMAELQKAMMLPEAPARASAPAAPPAPDPAPAPAAAPEAQADDAAPAAAKAGVVDPMLWWSALTRQFAELATQAVQDGGAGLARGLGQPSAPATGKKATPAAKKAPAKKAPRR
jgi:hypothetical protein